MPRPLLLLLAGLAGGCGGAGVPPGPPSPPERGSCLLGAEAVRRAAPVVAAAAGADTALVSDARSRTPLALDCEGVPRPRVASAWSHDSARTAWTLTVDDAAALATAWRERPGAAALRYAGVMSVIPLDQHRLTVVFDTPQRAVPGVFADLALAAPGEQEPALRLAPASGSDLRDALDGGADLVISADPTVLDYARTRTGWTGHALPWSRTYVLLAPAGSLPALDIPAGDSAGFRDALARDAVRVAARGARPPYWWEQAPDCARPPPPGGAPAAAVLYPNADPVARSLAERIVAMARAPGLVARGLPPAALESALARGTGALAVTAVPSMALVPCRELAAWPRSASAIPLIETRASALVREGIGPLVVDHDGGLVPETAR